MNNNYLTYLSYHHLSGLNNLMWLNLSFNPLSFAGLSPPNILILDVSGTSLILPQGLPLSNLLFLSFSQRTKALLSSIYPSSLANAQLLEELLFQNSRIFLTEVWDKSQHVSIFHGPEKLKFIDISDNHFPILPRGLLPNLTRLREIDLSNCGITAIERGIFDDLISLHILHLDHNIVLKLGQGLFNTMMTQMKQLYLHSNLLENLDDSLFRNIPNLTTLTLSENQLTILHESTFKPLFSTLKSIDVSVNPLACSCQLKWLAAWRNGMTQIIRAKQTICSPASDAAFRGKSLFTISPSELCASNVILHWLLPLIGLGLLATVSVVYYKRLLIKYKLFLLKLAIVGYQEAQDPRLHTDFQFDLNIMFTGEDQAWAEEHLLPNVQEQIPDFQRVAFGDEDLPLGMYWLDAVLYLIEHSFKNILLLSRAATRDHEFMMKLRTALNHVTNERTLCTLLIFLEDIPDQELPHLVKLYLSEERPYLCWVKNDAMGQYYFWKKLVKRLTINLRINHLVPPE